MPRESHMRIARWVLMLAVVVSPVALTACDSPNSRSDVMAPSPAELSEEAHFRAGAGGMFNGDSIYYHRVSAGRILEDGSVAIALLGGDARVILLDSLGGPSAVVGRQGRGPGEFLAPSLLYPLGRSLLAVFDLGNRRISLVTEDGIVGETSASRLPASHEVIGFLDDSLAVSTPRASGATRGAAGAPRTYQVWRMTSAGLETHRAFSGPTDPPAPMFTLSNPSGPDYNMWQGDGCLPQVQHVAGPFGVWVGDASTGVLTLFDEFGEGLAEFRDTTAPILSRATRDGLEARIAETERSTRATYSGESKRAALAALGDVGEPLPSYWSDILLDDEGGVWLEVAMCTWEHRDRTWVRFDSAARKTGTVAVPAGLRLLAVRGVVVLAVQTDSLGIESPGLFRVEDPD